MIPEYYNVLDIADITASEIISYYEDKVVESKDKVRRCKEYNETNKDSFLYQYCEKFIQINIDQDHFILDRIKVLRYDEGDYFKSHTDGYHNSKNKSLDYHFYGGVELSDEKDFEGGKFIHKGKERSFKKGVLVLHKHDEEHEVTPVTKGTRWSIHFPITNKRGKTLL